MRNLKSGEYELCCDIRLDVLLDSPTTFADTRAVTFYDKLDFSRTGIVDFSKEKIDKDLLEMSYRMK